MEKKSSLGKVKGGMGKQSSLGKVKGGMEMNTDVVLKIDKITNLLRSTSEENNLDLKVKLKYFIFLCINVLFSCFEMIYIICI
jgi:hypothetical protein